MKKEKLRIYLNGQYKADLEKIADKVGLKKVQNLSKNEIVMLLLEKQRATLNILFPGILTKVSKPIIALLTFLITAIISFAISHFFWSKSNEPAILKTTEIPILSVTNLKTGEVSTFPNFINIDRSKRTILDFITKDTLQVSSIEQYIILLNKYSNNEKHASEKHKTDTIKIPKDIIHYAIWNRYSKSPMEYNRKNYYHYKGLYATSRSGSSAMRDQPSIPFTIPIEKNPIFREFPVKINLPPQSEIINDDFFDRIKIITPNGILTTELQQMGTVVGISEETEYKNVKSLFNKYDLQPNGRYNVTELIFKLKYYRKNKLFYGENMEQELDWVDNFMKISHFFFSNQELNQHISNEQKYFNMSNSTYDR